MHTLQAKAVESFLGAHPGYKMVLSKKDHDVTLDVVDQDGNKVVSVVGCSMAPVGSCDLFYNGVDSAMSGLVNFLAASCVIRSGGL
jgi:hypothetical protein